MEHVHNPSRITLIGGGNPGIPVDFINKLRAFDPTLHVTWNDKKKRFVIEQCTEHFSPTPYHNHTCRRIYVWLVRDEEDGSMIPLGDHVIEKLKSIDVSRQGYGPKDHQKWCADRQREDEANRAEIQRKMGESVTNARKDNRRQLLRAIHLMQQHSMVPNR